MSELHLHSRIDELGELAEEYLEEVPTELSGDEALDNSEYAGYIWLYEECIDMISIIRSELDYGVMPSKLEWED